MKELLILIIIFIGIFAAGIYRYNKIYDPQVVIPEPNLGQSMVGSEFSDSGDIEADTKGKLTPIQKAIDYLASLRDQYPDYLAITDTIYRQFEITEFKRSLLLYDSMLKEMKKDEKLGLELWRRIMDKNNSYENLSLDEFQRDIIYPALYCDVQEVPTFYYIMIEGLINGKGGGYDLTHILLANQWLKENNCASLNSDLENIIINKNADLINTDSTITDLELEAAAFLGYAGQAQLIPNEFKELVTDSQNYDGGWSEDSSDDRYKSNGHSTIVALWYLLATENPEQATAPMLSQ